MFTLMLFQTLRYVCKEGGWHSFDKSFRMKNSVTTKCSCSGGEAEFTAVTDWPTCGGCKCFLLLQVKTLKSLMNGQKVINGLPFLEDPIPIKSNF